MRLQISDFDSNCATGGDMRLQIPDFDSNCATGGGMRLQISEPKVIIL